ncbi:MAG: DUF4040 domain-containing protein [Chloroflexi bacterium]|nr:DUF4040 domain-containing protein [Chloroflexota bacterium]
MSSILLVAGILVCAVQAIRATRLLVAALWLAGTSGLLAILLYMLGAHEVAVVELSVGAGLVTVLFVFAIGIAGEEAMDAHGLLPTPLATGLAILPLLLLGWLILPVNSTGYLAGFTAGTADFSNVLWQQRGLDVLVQIVLIFAGVVAVLGLLAEVPAGAREDKVSPAEGVRVPSNKDLLSGTTILFAPEIRNQQAEIPGDHIAEPEQAVEEAHR